MARSRRELSVLPGTAATRPPRTTADLLAELLRHVVDLVLDAGPDAERRLLAVQDLLTRQSDGPASCRRVGRRWRVEAAGRTAYVGQCVGMNHLAVLLANPHQEIPALELVRGFALPDRPAGQVVEDAQPVLDDLARRRYKQRLSELESEIDDFEAMNDAERAATARAERDWLLDELTAATGLAGRVRPFAGSAERARVAVSKAIRRALDRIAQADPVIGGELRTTVQTGMRCCYRPG
ncbi:hypothetical protein SAMN05444920_1011108 [Nonomuraea solani]|uniref:Uncharacterized protein n=1 Tax=Nonomuraea solani TaxID=1144553 RepID=A0A1H5W9Y2_9ACTN|nr:hypothetical protein [Nonomuraea solani]SEF95617.1 hypothetical protein SAMN05444920_1011108 [Nonomuraea solani]